jgi:hypothetical protein
MKINLFMVFVILLPFSVNAEGIGVDDHKEPIRKVIRENIESFRRCYNKIDSQKGAKPEGKIFIEWEVSDLGKSAEVKVFRDELNLPTLNECIVSEISKMKFPAAPQGKTFSIRYPFIFKPQPQTKRNSP